MANPVRLFGCALIVLSISLLSRPAVCITVGGWTAARGGDSAVLAGADFETLRNDLSGYFVGATLAESTTLTSTFLNSIDVLAISPVSGGGGIPITPLSAAEQSAMTTWVSGGGRALIVGENFNYHAASQSMIGPFGPQWESASINGGITGTVTDHTSFPAITNGPFGVVNTFSAGYDAYFTDVSPATPLGEWGANEVCLAAMNFGSGKVVFFGSNSIFYGVDANFDPNNDTLRRNTLAYLLGVAPRNRYDYNNNGEVDAADYVLWRKTFGESGVILAADGNFSHQIDDPDYEVWRAHFGETNAPGFGASNLTGGAAGSASAIPEPTSTTLLLIFIYVAATRRNLCITKPLRPPLAA